MGVGDVVGAAVGVAAGGRLVSGGSVAVARFTAGVAVGGMVAAGASVGAGIGVAVSATESARPATGSGRSAARQVQAVASHSSKSKSPALVNRSILRQPGIRVLDGDHLWPPGAAVGLGFRIRVSPASGRRTRLRSLSQGQGHGQPGAVPDHGQLDGLPHSCVKDQVAIQVVEVAHRSVVDGHDQVAAATSGCAGPA